MSWSGYWQIKFSMSREWECYMKNKRKKKKEWSLQEGDTGCSLFVPLTIGPALAIYIYINKTLLWKSQNLGKRLKQPQGLRDLVQQLEGKGVTTLPALPLPEARLGFLQRENSLRWTPSPLLQFPSSPPGSPLIGIIGETSQAFPLRIR